MPYCPEFLLQHLQHFIENLSQIKQIHCLLITNGYLINTTSTSPWQSTLFYNTLIRAHLYFKQPNTSLLHFTHMLHHQAPPNSHTFPPLFKAAVSASFAALNLGTSLHAQALKRGVLTDPFVQTSLLNFYAAYNNLYNARKMFEEISSPSLVECNAMIDAHCKNGDMGSAVLMFSSMPKRDVVSWTSVINGFVTNGCFVEAIQFFKKMITCLVRPNEATYVSLLSLCANFNNGGSLYIGKQIHGYIVRKEILLTTFMGTALIDFYGKVGCLESAIRVFDRLFDREVCTWNAMISSLASNGREKQAVDMFEKMKVEGLSPNEVTFIAILTACSRARLVYLGLKLFQSMVSEHRVVPIMEHYGCVVDLLGRAGLLSEANEFVNNMPLEPDASVLGPLLAACKIHTSIEMGSEVGKRLVALQPQHCGRYVLLSIINAQVGRWVNATDLREAMIEAGIDKIPAFSSIASVQKLPFQSRTNNPIRS